MKDTYLYIKRHKITGLLYMGKTVQDPYTYKGSGIRWTRHLKKYGNDVDTIWVSSLFKNSIEINETAVTLSEIFDIVNDKKWANLVPENGIAGGAIRNGMKHSEETKQLLRKFRTGKKDSDEVKLKKSLSRLGKKQTDLQKAAMSKYNKNRTLPEGMCPVCNKRGSYVAMRRWHYDRCRVGGYPN